MPLEGTNPASDIESHDGGEENERDAALAKSREDLPNHVWWSLAKAAFLAKHGTVRKCFYVRSLSPCAVEENWHQRKRAEQFASTGTIEDVAQITPVKRKRITDFFSPNKNRLC